MGTLFLHIPSKNYILDTILFSISTLTINVLFVSISRHPLLHGHDHSSNASDSQSEVTPKKPHIKKPLNAFMLFMKEQRSIVAAECTLKESAAINQILGRRVSGTHYFLLCRYACHSCWGRVLSFVG